METITCLWSRSMKIALYVKNKIEFIDGTIAKSPTDDLPQQNLWKCSNNIVIFLAPQLRYQRNSIEHLILLNTRRRFGTILRNISNEAMDHASSNCGENSSISLQTINQLEFTSQNWSLSMRSWAILDCNAIVSDLAGKRKSSIISFSHNMFCNSWWDWASHTLMPVAQFFWWIHFLR